MIYRTSRFNENKTTDLLITKSGIDEMVNRLNIKSELDIRRVDNNENGGLTTSPLGSEEDLYKDYLYSNFANIGRSRSPSTIKDYLTLINSSDGESLAEKTKNYLIDLGVDEEDINVLIDMMK